MEEIHILHKISFNTYFNTYSILIAGGRKEVKTMTWKEDIWSTDDTGYQIPTLHYSGPHTAEEYLKNDLTEITVKYEDSMLN